MISYGEEGTHLQKVLKRKCVESPGAGETWTSPSYLQRFWFRRLGMCLGFRMSDRQEILLLVHAHSPQGPAPLQAGGTSEQRRERVPGPLRDVSLCSHLKDTNLLFFNSSTGRRRYSHISLDMKENSSIQTFRCHGHQQSVQSLIRAPF